MVPNRFTGVPWTVHLDEVEAARPKHGAEDRDRRSPPETPYLRRQRHLELDGDLDLSRRNAERLIAAGCIVTIGSDSYLEPAPEFGAGPRTDDWYTPGLATVRGLEGLVELGMSPSAALEVATRNGALACRAERELGTLDAGKVADLVVLDADPLRDVANVRRVSLVISRGQLVDLAGLPRRSVYERVSSAN
jgi:cytosine/adenosine deaminase-related metal-dependent hydrolase